MGFELWMKSELKIFYLCKWETNYSGNENEEGVQLAFDSRMRT